MTPIGPADAAQAIRAPVDTSSAKSRLQEIVQQITKLTGQEISLSKELAAISSPGTAPRTMPHPSRDDLVDMVRGTREKIEHLKQEKEALEQSMLPSISTPAPLSSSSVTEKPSDPPRRTDDPSEEEQERIDLLHTFLPPELLGQIIHECDQETLKNLLLCSKAERNFILANMGPEAALLFVKANPDNYIRLSPNNPSKTDSRVVEETLRRKPALFFELPEALQNDPILRMVSYLSAHLKSDQVLCQQLIQFDEDNQPNCLATFAQIVSQVMGNWYFNESCYRANCELANNLEVMTAFVIACPKLRKLQFASDSLKKNPALVLAAVTYDGRSLEFAASELRKDPKIVLAAVKQDGFALEYVAPELRKDPKIVLAAVTIDGRMLAYAAPELQHDPKFVLAAVTLNGFALQFAAPELRKDPKIVLAAVSKNGGALMFAALELQDDQKIVQAAIKQNPLARMYASARLRAILGRHGELLADIHPE